MSRRIPLILIWMLEAHIFSFSNGTGFSKVRKNLLTLEGMLTKDDQFSSEKHLKRETISDIATLERLTQKHIQKWQKTIALPKHWNIILKSESYFLTKNVYIYRVATGQGKVREIQGQGKVRECRKKSGKFRILKKIQGNLLLVREILMFWKIFYSCDADAWLKNMIPVSFMGHND